MTGYSNHIPSNVIKKLRYSNDDELVKATKRLYLKEINNKHGGKNFIRNIASKHSIEGEEYIESLSSVLKLSEVYYYLSYLFTAIQSKEICTFNSEKIQFDNNEIFNEFGQPIWVEELNKSPKLWNVIQEDQEHIFFTYIHKGSEHVYFDSITHVFKKYYETALINYRIHFDNNLIEISSKNSTQQGFRESLASVTEILKLSNINYKEIDDEAIRIFDSVVDKVTYERREGDEASASMTRVNNESDTRKDPIRSDLSSREFRKENGLLILENNVRSIVGLTRGKPGKIQIRSYLSPDNQIKIFHKIIDILGW
jgi:hypothetical protein